MFKRSKKREKNRERRTHILSTNEIITWKTHTLLINSLANYYYFNTFLSHFDKQGLSQPLMSQVTKI